MSRLRINLELAARLSLSACVVACGSGTARERAVKSVPAADTCRIRLAPATISPKRMSALAQQTSSESPAPVITKASRLVVHTALKLEPLRRELEAKIERRLAAAQGVKIGILGSLNYTLDRGPLTLAVENDALVVRTEVQAKSEVCRRNCSPGCEPRALVRAEVPLTLLPNYRFGPSRVTARFTRGCKISTLGGFVKIDVTRAIEARLQPELAKVQRRIDGQLPALQEQAEMLWRELSKPRKLPLGGCVVVQPQALVQGPASATRGLATLSFALLAMPEFRTRCGEVEAMLPLPSLVHDANLPAEDDVTLGLVMPLEQVSAALGNAQALELGNARARVAKAAITSSRENIEGRITLSGEVCGDIDINAALGFSSDGRALALVSPSLSRDSAERVSRAGLDPKTLAAALARSTRITLPVAVDQVDDVLPLLAKSLSDKRADVQALVSSVEPAGAAARGEDFVSWLTLRGRLELTPK